MRVHDGFQSASTPLAPLPSTPRVPQHKSVSNQTTPSPLLPAEPFPLIFSLHSCAEGVERVCVRVCSHVVGSISSTNGAPGGHVPDVRWEPRRERLLGEELRQGDSPPTPLPSAPLSSLPPSTPPHPPTPLRKPPSPPQVKAANAKLPILLREASGTSAKLTGVFGERERERERVE